MNFLVIEHEEIYRHVYGLVARQWGMELLGIHPSLDAASLNGLISNHRPQVLVIGIKALDANLIQLLGRIREDWRDTGLVLLFSTYQPEDMEALRRMVAGRYAGVTVFLRHSLSQIHQLADIIKAAGNRRVIVDPVLLLFSIKPACSFLKQLTCKELEVLNLVANGYTNPAIGKALFIDVKTVENHLNNIYSKLKASENLNDKHLRVEAARLYMRKASEVIAV